MDFLKKKVDSERRIALVKQGFDCRKQSDVIVKGKGPKHHKKAIAAALISTDGASVPSVKKDICVFCDKNHVSNECFSARRMSDEDKRKALQKSKRCFVCIRPGHCSRQCKANVSCIVCEKRHYAIMCPELHRKRDVLIGKPKINEEVRAIDSVPKEESAINVEGLIEAEKATMMTARSFESDVALMTLSVFAGNGDKEILVRCLLDCGSQHSYLSVSAAKRLQLKPVREVRIVHGLFGGSETHPLLHKVYKINLINLQRSYELIIEVRDQKKICGEVAMLSAEEMGELLQYDNIAMAHHKDTPMDIELLLGADVLKRLLTGTVKMTQMGLLGVHTKLGWTVMGASDREESRETVLSSLSLHVNELDTTELWNVETLGIKDPIETSSVKTRQDDLMRQFRETIKVTNEGRYQVNLPFRENHVVLPSYKAMAWKRHQVMMNRLEKNGLLKSYQDIFDEWERLHIIDVVPSHELSWHACYLPHRPVIKEESLTTKIRPVFDASAKSRGEASLNDCLEKESNLIEIIPEVIDRFRRHSVGVTADIEKAFLQLEVNPEQKDFLRFYNTNGREYRHRRVVFGVSSSPFLLGAVLGHYLKRMKSAHPDTVELLERSFYVDNLVTSVDSRGKLNALRRDATELMQKAKK